MTTFPSAIDRLTQAAGNLEAVGNITGETPPDQINAPSFAESWSARSGTTWIQGLVDLFNEPSAFDNPYAQPIIHRSVQGAVGMGGQDLRQQDGFNPFSFISGNPNLKEDQRIRFLAERGQFDDVTSEPGFWHAYNTGIQFLDDSAALERTSNGVGLLTWAGSAVGDPLNLVPLGLAAKGIRAGGALARSAKFGAILGGAGLAAKSLQTALQPVSNEPGITDEALAVGISAGLGSAMGLILRPMNGLDGISTAKLKQVQADAAKAYGDIPIRDQIPKAQFTEATREFFDVRAKDVTFQREFANGIRLVRNAIDEPAVEHRTVSALHVPGDEVAGLLGELKKKYADAGVPLNVVEHPLQGQFETLKLAEKIINEHNLDRPATQVELGGGIVDRTVGAVTGAFSTAQSLVTPGGRAARNTLARVQRFVRTVSGSEATVATGSAADAFGFEAGTSAENIKGQTDGLRQRAIVDTRLAWSNAKAKARAGEVTFEGRPIRSREEFLGAVDEVLRREQAIARGYQYTPIKDLHPAIAKAVKVHQDFYAAWRNNLETAGLLKVGPRALADAEAEHAATVESYKAWEAYRGSGPDNASPVVKPTGKEITSDAVAASQQRVADLAEAVKRQGKYLPTVFNTVRIKADTPGFTARVRDALYKHDSTVDGRLVEPDARPIRMEAIEKMDRAAVMDWAATRQGKPTLAPGAAITAEPDLAAAIKGAVESDLPEPMRTAYRAHLDAFYKRVAEHVADTLTHPTEHLGVADSVGRQDPLMERVLRLDHYDLIDYLERDPETLIERYDAVNSGRYGVSRAIQLNRRMWQGETLADGTPVTDGATLKQYLMESVNGLDEFGRQFENPAVVEAASKLRESITNNLFMPLDRVEGRNPLPTVGYLAPFQWMGRNLLRISYLNKAGSFIWANMNDAGPIALHMITSPTKIIPMLREALTTISKMSSRDLESVGVLADNMVRARAIGDLEQTAAGFGTGNTQRITSAVERGLDRGTEVMGRIGLLSYWNTAMQRLAALQVIDRVTEQSRRLLLAQDLVNGGMEKSAALRKVGLSEYDAARLNKLGFNIKNSRQYHRLTYEHGTLRDGTALKDAATFDEYMAGRFKKNMVRPGFNEWDMGTSASGRANRDLFDTVSANIHGEATRTITVKPGEFDKPLINQSVFGRLFNQFQTFGMAFVNQRMRVMAQMPADTQLWYAMSYVALGATSNAISAHLSGKRSFAQTIEKWQSEPLAMMYAATADSGLLGWLGRPLSAMDALGMGIGPKRLLGTEAGTRAATHIAIDDPLAMFGPAAGDVSRFASKVVPHLPIIGSQPWDKNASYNAWKLAPAQNLVWFRLMHQMTGAPTVPEALRER